MPRRTLFAALLWCLLIPWANAAAPAADAAAEADAIHARVDAIAHGADPWLQQQRKVVIQALADVYRDRHYAPAWTQATLAALLPALQSLTDDGLDPRDYGLPALRRAAAQPAATPAQRARDDVLASSATIVALSHLYWGKTDPRQLDPRWNFPERKLDYPQALRLIEAGIDSGQIDDLFTLARPQNHLYQALRQALQRLHETAAAGGWPRIPPGPTLDPGARDARVAALRARLIAAGDLPADAADAADGKLLDSAVEAALRSFQRRHDLADDGRLGPATRAALNVPVQARIAQLRVNLERARWLLHDLGEDFVLVDVAGYRAWLFRHSHAVWSARVQVGKPYRSTPSFTSTITHITFNPTWTVPQTIFTEDLLPKIRRDPGYLAREHIRIFNGGGRELDPRQVDWSAPQGLTLRQDAGPGNALDSVAIRFPNPYAVYLHGTPHRELFSRRQRAFSSGCIRVEDPLTLARLLLDDPANWSAAAIEAVIAEGSTRNVPLARPVRILLIYWTVDVLGDGRIAYKADIYGEDPLVYKALRSGVRPPA
jgi:murein L,D-transpeptidase YcbB/YkuD